MQKIPSKFKSNQKGWFDHSYRHSLSAKGIENAPIEPYTTSDKFWTGVKTGSKAVGKGLWAGTKWTGSKIKDIFTDDKNKEEYQEEINKQDSNAHIQEILSKRHIEETNTSVLEDEEDIEKRKLIDKVRDEVGEVKSRFGDELENPYPDIEGKGSGFFDGFLSDIFSKVTHNQYDALREKKGRITSAKQLYKDKLEIINNVRSQILSKNYLDKASISDQLDNIQETDKAVRKLSIGLNKLDMKEEDVDTQINALRERQKAKALIDLKKEMAVTKGNPEKTEYIWSGLLGAKGKKKMSPKARAFLSKKIRANIREGKPKSQAVAISYSQAREQGFKLPKRLR
jgi:hypothetical protein